MFWRLTPRELHVIMAGYVARRMDEHDRARMVAHEVARLIGFSFHDPKSTPDFVATGANRAEQSTATDDAMVRAWFIGMSMRTKN